MRFTFREEDGTPITKVHVNPLTKKVSFKNYKEYFLDKAFGVKEDVTYNDVLYFLEKRTVPRNREDINEILTELHLKEYDPVALCKFFGGRIASDNRYIEFD